MKAVCEAVTRPTLRFVPVKSPEQQAALSMHRTRDLLVKQRTRLINVIRDLLAEVEQKALYSHVPPTVTWQKIRASVGFIL
jgi:transposase